MEGLVPENTPEEVVEECANIVEETLEREFKRLETCGCHSCRLRAMELIEGWYQNQEVTEEMWQFILANWEDE